MADKRIQVEILTPERPLATEAADEVNFPAVDGYMGVLPEHTPLVAELGIGEVTFLQGQALKRFMVSGGFVQVFPDRVSILADEAKAPEDVDREQAETEIRKAAEDLEKAELPEEVNAALELEKRAQTKLELLGK